MAAQTDNEFDVAVEHIRQLSITAEAALLVTKDVAPGVIPRLRKKFARMAVALRIEADRFDALVQKMGAKEDGRVQDR